MSLTPALFKQLQPKSYIDKFFQEGIRPDGRPITSQKSAQTVRQPRLNFGSISTASSSCLVSLDKTTVLCGITLETAPPNITTPTQGFIVSNVDLPPLCSSMFKPGAPSATSQILANKIQHILLTSNIIDLSSLLIEASKAAFVVYVDIVCLSYDGALIDAALLAVVGALFKLVLPEARYDEDEQIVICEPISSEHPGRKLVLSDYPVSLSFATFQNKLLPDPTLFESTNADSITTAIISSKDPERVYAFYRSGSNACSLEDMSECLLLAREHAKNVRQLLA